MGKNLVGHPIYRINGATRLVLLRCIYLKELKKDTFTE